ncbi:hypothetical protein LPJ66_001529 [Kickxella alabastrina]|uniref:Uncharacterized protein n=1 Tax=Kickxella alabastrina TaxID=61397 RepID=A0ACC1ISZ7_9FUNG|nr:hypothetical protein LPJ66_001529 [Kickxella alabastrina]
MIRRPVPYDGTGNITEWCLLMRFYVMAVSTAFEEHLLASAILANLSGPPSSWAVTQINVETGRITAEPADFIAALISEFTPFADNRQAEAELDVIMQTGTIQEYITAFQRLVLRIHGMTDDDQRRHFRRGLKPSIKRAVDMGAPTTLTEARRLTIIASTDYTELIQTRTPPCTPAPPPHDHTAMDINAFQTLCLNHLSYGEHNHLC